MIIAVTGGCGFIGRHLVGRLLQDGCRVVVLDDFSSGSPDLLAASPNLEIVRGCVTDAEAMRAALAGASRIFHLAALVGQIKVRRLPEWASRVSTESMAHINRIAPRALLVLISSSAVYGPTGDGLCREDREIAADAPLAYDGGVPGYACGKWLSEGIAGERAPGTTLIVRPFNVIGPGQIGTYGMVVPRFVESALAGEPLTIYGSGEQTRSFGDVQAFVGHLLALVDVWNRRGSRDSLFNLGSRIEVSINQLAERVDRVLGTVTPRRYVPYEAIYPCTQDVKRRRPCLDRIERLLGPLAWPTLDHTIERVAAVISDSFRADSPSVPLQIAL